MQFDISIRLHFQYKSNKWIYITCDIMTNKILMFDVKMYKTELALFACESKTFLKI